MLPFVLPDRANVPSEEGKLQRFDNIGGHVLTTSSPEMGRCDPMHHCRWHRLDHP